MKAPRLRSRTILAILAAGVLAAGATPSRAQRDPYPFSERIDVRLVNVEVVVEERDGRRVTGLGPEAFRLLIDGQPVALSHFAEIRGGRAVDEGPTGPGSPPALSAGAAVGNSYLVYIDDYFSIGVHKNLAIDQLLRQLDRIEPPDRMAVVAFGGRDLELLSGWSDDRRQLRAALESAKSRPSFGLLRFSERLRQGIPVFGGARGGYFNGEAEYELGRTAAALQATLHGFADAPGRKIAIVLSGGWPSLDPAVAGRRRFTDRYENDLEILAPVVDTANLLGFTLYPVDLPGLRPTATTRIAGPSEFDTSWRETAGDRNQPDTNVAALDPNSSFVYGQRFDTFFPGRRSFFSEPNEHGEILRQSTLRVLGRDTGGRALLGSDRRQALGAIVDDTGSYYWLSFSPRRAFDDRAHRIEVEVTGGYRVRNRRSFRDLSIAAQTEMATLGAALIGRADAVDELRVSLGRGQKAGWGKVELPVRIEIPVDRVVFVPDGDRFVARLELRLAAVAAADRHSEVPIIDVPLSLASAPAPGDVLPFETTVTVSRAAHTLAVSLYDPVGARVLLATVAISR